MDTMQNEIIREMGVKPAIDPEEEVRKRIDFLKAYVKKTGMNGYVLGISGGQDSSLLGKLLQMAMEELNRDEQTSVYTFKALRLPYGEQKDEDDAQKALQFIAPYEQYTFNIEAAVAASLATFERATGEVLNDFVKGNTKARERMKVQYDLGAHTRCLVAGTDHAGEAVTGFFTKFGDGSCDVAPLFGLNKRQGAELLKYLGAPADIFEKAPTADLEDDRPLIADEEALGISYKDIDDYLEGRTIAEDVQKKLEHLYKVTAHKRALPVTIFDDWWKRL
ncbi:NH(3)-dependent NAD(+) synthetase [Salisediminibacterium halotolerans]|nr:NH(3)-dependent NAD(+) synthetase [Actinophytocola xinjiangensis]RPE87798.1 NH(3)-dependent NAD(+) synthetase [Salisediminibacterium halotolerans]TWG34945.1 NH(3)-dependent NAD(+) synthetase [Salisediminibacterium halotolerans]